MKFTDGYWLNRPEYNIQSPKMIFDYEINEDNIIAYAPFKDIDSRNDELNVGMMTIQLKSPIEDVIGVKLMHFDQNSENPNYELADKQLDMKIESRKQLLSLQTGKLEATISKEGPFDVTFKGSDGVLTKSALNSEGFISNIKTGQNYMREKLSIAYDELIYGFGERFTAFVKNGQEIEINQKDGGTGSEQSYKNIPFYISNKGYGVFVNQPEVVSFEVASEDVDKVQFSVEGESMEYYLIYGPTPKEIIRKYTELTGKVTLPPAWSFGLWLSTSFTTDYSEETVMSYINEMKERNIPLDVFHFDCFWQKDFEWCNFEWNKDMFPNPEQLINRIHDAGVKVCVWINPYIAQKSPLFEEGKKKGYFIKKKDGNVWQCDMWQAGMGIVDFTNPMAKKWYQDKLKTLLDIGVDCFKTDFGERIPVDNVIYYDDSNPKKEHNYYTYQYNEAVFDLLKQEKGESEAVLFARSATVGSQKFPVHWGGDNLSTYNSMADSLRGGLSFLISGFGFWSHDIGGFEEEATPDIYKRWTQFGLLSSHSRYHGSVESRVPWNFDEEAVDVTRKFVNLKLSLMPYLYTEAVETTNTGVPLMRPMFVEYPKDHNTAYLDRQYMLGSNLLVAPIFNKEGVVDFYVPTGKWTNMLNESFYDIKEGRWLEEKYDYLSLPLLVREDSIIVRGNNRMSANYDYTDNVTIHLYNLKEGRKSQVVVNSVGKSVAVVKTHKFKKKYVVEVEGLTEVTNVVVHECGMTFTHSLGEFVIEYK